LFYVVVWNQEEEEENKEEQYRQTFSVDCLSLIVINESDWSTDRSSSAMCMANPSTEDNTLKSVL
jgi:hypothetical protein